MIEFSCIAALSLASECAGKTIKNEEAVEKCIVDYAKQCNATSCNATVTDDNSAILAELECSLVDFVRSSGQLVNVLKQFGGVKINYADDRIHVISTIDL